MSDKIDTLFSPERLRGKWTSPNHGLKQNKPMIPAGYFELYVSIRETIGKHFSGENRKFLYDLMDQLKPLLDLRFSTTDKLVPSDEEIQGLNQCIDKSLAQIEDLVEAFEIQDKHS